MCTRQRLCAHAHKLTIGQNVPMVYECTACAHAKAYAHTRTSSPLDRICQWATSAQHVHTTTLARTRAQAPLDRMCNDMCARTRQRLRAHAHKLTIGQNVPMVYECTACAHDITYAHKLTIGQNVPMIRVHTHDNACAHTRTSSPLDIMCQ